MTQAQTLPAQITAIERVLAESPNDRSANVDCLKGALILLRASEEDSINYVCAARCVGTALRNIKRIKRHWAKEARSAFRPSPRRACDICGKYKSLTAAHHLVPLAIQFDRGMIAPSSDHAWLCPTHHAAVHVLIGQIKAGGAASDACVAVIFTGPPKIGDISDESPDGWARLLAMAQEVLR